jgi:DNA-binding SARP family transcriptional activator
LLLLNANVVVRRERLIDGLWGEGPPETAVKMVQVYVSRLRRLLPAGVLLTRPRGYLFAVDPESVDLLRFERLVGEARGAEPARAAGLLAEALSLWRGPALAEFEEPFARPEARRLDELRLAALEARIGADLALGRQGVVVVELEALVGERPLREGLRELLMLALYRAGRQADALAVYQETRTLLVGELGLEPGQSLQRLEQAILRHDPALELGTQAATLPPAEAEVAARDGAALPVRKTVTAVVAGVAEEGGGAGSDPESLRLLLERFLEAAAAVLGRHGGAVDAFVGSGVVGVFGVPVAHEDDAERAVRAAAELRAALGELNRALRRDFGAALALRIGVATGEVVVAADAGVASEGVVATAARLQHGAAAGEVVLGAETVTLTRDAVRAEPLSTDGAVAGFRLLAVGPRAPRVARRLDAPMVGRARERVLLEDAFLGAAARPGCVLVTVLGEAGVGKSRLAREFLSGVEARVLEGRCLSYGEGITYAPLVELVSQLGGVHRELLVETPAAAAALASVLGESAAATSPEEIAWAARKLFESLARERPLVLLLDDMQWAEPAFLDLAEQVARLSTGAPILLLCLARHELLERRPGWGSRQPNATTVALEPLEPVETDELIGHLLHGQELAPGLTARIRTAAEGNPLFVEEMLAIVQASGSDEVVVPPSIKALLAARIDQLDPAERELLGYGAVEGELFHRGGVETLATGPVERHLAALVEKELLLPDRGQLASEEAYRFRHLLIRDAAYNALPKATRADLHERFAAWLEQHGAELVTRDEILGYHLEQAYRYHSKLGAADGDSRELAARAGRHLGAAGLRADARGDVRAGANLLARATGLLPPEGAERLELLLPYAYAVRQSRRGSGKITESNAIYDEVYEKATALGDRRLAAHARLHRTHDPFATLFGADSDSAVYEELIATFEELSDEVGLAQTKRALGMLRRSQNRGADAVEWLEQALVHANAGGDQPTRRTVTQSLAGALTRGPTPVDQATNRCEELLEANRDDRELAAAIMRHLGLLYAMAGRFEDAREYESRAALVLEEGRLETTSIAYLVVSADTKELLGDRAGAERDLRRKWQEKSERGTDGAKPLVIAVVTAGWLANFYCDEGRWDDAEACLAAYPGYPWGFAGGHGRGAAEGPRGDMAEARLKAHRGEHDKALELARSIVEHDDRGDELNTRALMWLGLAEVQHKAGRTDEARASVANALALYRQKGNVAAAARLRAAPLAGLSKPATVPSVTDNGLPPDKL